MMADCERTGDDCDGYVSEGSFISDTTHGTTNVNSPSLFHGLKLLSQTPVGRKHRDSNTDPGISPVIPSQNISSRFQRLKKTLANLDSHSEGCTSDNESVVSESILTNTATRTPHIRHSEVSTGNTVTETSEAIQKTQIYEDSELGELCDSGPAGHVSENKQSSHSSGCEGFEMPTLEKYDTKTDSVVENTEDEESCQLRPKQFRECDGLGAERCGTRTESTLEQHEDEEEKQPRPGYNPTQVLDDLFDSAPTKSKSNSPVDMKDTGPSNAGIPTDPKENVTYDSDSTKPDTNLSQQFDSNQANVYIGSVVMDLCAESAAADSGTAVLSQRKQSEGSKPASSQLVPSSDSRTSSSLDEERMKTLLTGSQVSEVTTASSDLLLENKDISEMRSTTEVKHSAQSSAASDLLLSHVKTDCSSKAGTDKCHGHATSSKCPTLNNADSMELLCISENNGKTQDFILQTSKDNQTNVLSSTAETDNLTVYNEEEVKPSGEHYQGNTSIDVVKGQSTSIIQGEITASQTEGLSTQLLDFIVEFSQVSKASSVKSLDLTSDLLTKKDSAFSSVNIEGLSDKRTFSCFGTDKDCNKTHETGIALSSTSIRCHTPRLPGVCDTDSNRSFNLSRYPFGQGSVSPSPDLRDGRRLSSRSSTLQTLSSQKSEKTQKLTWKTLQPITKNDGQSIQQSPVVQHEYRLTEANSRNLTLPQKAKETSTAMTERNSIINLRTRYQTMMQILGQKPNSSTLSYLSNELKEIQVTISHINEQHKRERGNMSARVSQKGLSRSEKKQLKTELQSLGERQKHLVEIVHKHKEINSIVKQLIAEKERDSSASITGDGDKREEEYKRISDCSTEREKTSSRRDPNGTNTGNGVVGLGENLNVVEAGDTGVGQGGEAITDTAVLKYSKENSNTDGVIQSLTMNALRGNDCGSVIKDKMVGRASGVNPRNCKEGFNLLTDLNIGGKEIPVEKSCSKGFDSVFQMETVARSSAMKEYLDSEEVQMSSFTGNKTVNQTSLDQFLPATQGSLIEDSQQDLFSQESSRSGYDIDRKVVDDIIKSHETEDHSVRAGVTYQDMSMHKVTANMDTRTKDTFKNHSGENMSQMQTKSCQERVPKRKSVDSDEDVLKFCDRDSKKCKTNDKMNVSVDDVAQINHSVSQRGNIQTVDQTYEYVCPQDIAECQITDGRDKPAFMSHRQHQSNNISNNANSSINKAKAKPGVKKKGFIPPAVKSQHTGREVTLLHSHLTPYINQMTESSKLEEKSISAVKTVTESSEVTMSTSGWKESSGVPFGTVTNMESNNISHNQEETTVTNIHSQSTAIRSPDVEKMPKIKHTLMSPPVTFHERKPRSMPPEKTEVPHTMLSPCSTAASSDVFPVSCRELVRRIEAKDAREKLALKEADEEYFAIPIARIEDFGVLPSICAAVSKDNQQTQPKTTFVQPAVPVVKPVYSKITDLTFLVECGVLQPGKNVLSVVTKDRVFEASLTKKGHILDSGGEMFRTPTAWFQVITGSVTVKKQLAYNRVLYKGRPLSGFELPSMTGHNTTGNTKGIQAASSNKSKITQSTGRASQGFTPGKTLLNKETQAVTNNNLQSQSGEKTARSGDGPVHDLRKILSRCTIKLIDDAEIVACPEIDSKFWMSDFKDVRMSESLWDSVDTWS